MLLLLHFKPHSSFQSRLTLTQLRYIVGVDMAFYETGAVIWDVIGPELEMMYETRPKKSGKR